MWKTLTTQPPPQPPPQKHPLFTKDPLSTKSFGPGHLVGAGLLALAAFGFTKFIRKRAADAERARNLALGPRPTEDPKLASVRGEYGRRR